MANDMTWLINDLVLLVSGQAIMSTFLTRRP
jgi:hypothetical protein